MRIVQEAITNAVKHSGANQIIVEADIRMISVSDNGKGFTPGASSGPGTSGGIGIEGMRRRAKDLDISFSIKSSATGTSITLRW